MAKAKTGGRGAALNEKDLGQLINEIAFRMDYMKDPEDALADWGAPGVFFSAYEQQYFDYLVQIVAKETGGDPEQIADKNRRTEAQDRALLETSAKLQMTRLQAFMKSRYMKARLYVGELQGELDQRGALAVAYFFAIHPEIKPDTAGELTGAEAEALKGIYKRLAAFIAEKYGDVDLTGDDATATAIITAFAEAEDAEKLTPAEIHQLQKAAGYQLNNAKAFNKLILAIEPGETTGQLQIELSEDKRTNTSVIVYMSLTYQGDDSITIKGRRVITGFDKAVYNTVCTLYAAGNTTITATDIFKTMNGYNGQKPSAKQLDRIFNSVLKMMFTAIYLDVSEEVQRQRLIIDDARMENGKVITQMIAAAVVVLEAKSGKKVWGFKLTAEPIMYTYCKAKRQIITVPVALLDTAEAANNTEELTAIREYLLQQIENLKTGHRDNPTILYSTLYRETGIEPPTARKDAMRLRNQVKAILDVWKDRGYILGYKDAKTGAAISGITIESEPRTHK